MTDTLPIDSSLGADLEGAVKDLEFQKICQSNDKLGLGILSFLAYQKIIFSKEMGHQINDWLRWVVAQYAEKYSAKLSSKSKDRTEQEDIAIRLAEIVAWLTIEPREPALSGSRWNDFIYELSQIWTNLPVLLEPAFYQLWQGLPIEQLQGIGKNLLLAKAIR